MYCNETLHLNYIVLQFYWECKIYCKVIFSMGKMLKSIMERFISVNLIS